MLDFEKERMYRLTVQFYFKTFEEVSKMSEILKQSATIVNIERCLQKYPKENRLKCILNNLVFSEETRIGVLHSRLMKVYPLTYKSFQRDVAYLILNGYIKAVKSIGRCGRTTFLTKVKELIE
jgi:hypothetical protein